MHSMKDIASKVHEVLEIAPMLERIDPLDAFISTKARSLDELSTLRPDYKN